MATNSYTIVNQFKDVIQSDVIDGSETVPRRIGPAEEFVLNDDQVGPTMQIQINNGVLKITDTQPPITPIPALLGVTNDQRAALDAANAPAAGNPIATIADIELKDQASEISYDPAASTLTATDVKAAIDEEDAKVEAHTGMTSGNPHGVTAVEAGADAAGSAAAVQGNLTTHEGMTNNPHSVTAAQVAQGGVTASRPGAPVLGESYLDTDLNKPIWYNGAAWIDATGAVV